MVKHIHRSRWADVENLKSIAWGLQEPMCPRAQTPRFGDPSLPVSSAHAWEGWHGGARHCWTRRGGWDRLQGECKEQVRVRWGWAWASLQLSLSRGDGSWGVPRGAMVLGGGCLGPGQLCGPCGRAGAQLPKEMLVSAEKSAGGGRACFCHVWGQRGGRSLGSKPFLLFVIISKLFPPSHVALLCLKVHNFV